MNTTTLQMAMNEKETALWEAKGPDGDKFRAETKSMARYLSRHGQRKVVVLSAERLDPGQTKPQRRTLWTYPETPPRG